LVGTCRIGGYGSRFSLKIIGASTASKVLVSHWHESVRVVNEVIHLVNIWDKYGYCRIRELQQYHHSDMKTRNS
jgi:hypothetical protein